MKLGFRMPSLALACYCAACSGPTPSHDAVMFRGDPEHSGVYRTTGVDQLGGELWRFETGGPVRSTAAVVGDAVFVGSGDGNLYALDRASGSERWRFDAGGPVNSSPAVARGLVVFGSRDGAFFALDARSGAQRWRHETGELIPWEWGFEGWDVYTSSPVVVDTTVLFGAGDGVLYALELESGGELWRLPTGGRIRSTPAVADGTVFVGSTDGVVYAADLLSGEVRWTHETDGASLHSADLGVDRKSIITPPTVVAGAVYVGSRDGYLYSLDQATGERRWRADHEGSWAMSSPAVVGGRVYSGTSDGSFVHALDAASGDELWRFSAAGYTWSSPVVVGSTVYIGDGGGYLQALDRETGEQLWSYQVGLGIYSSPVVSDGVVFFGSDDGNVYALHGEGQLARRAVFWDEELTDFSYYASDVETRRYLEQQGYEVLDSDALAGFLLARLADGVPSVVVFAMDHLPAVVAAEPSDTTLFRRYLDAGGKVVWLGLQPALIERDPESGGFVGLDRAWPTALLGVDHSSLNFDFYGAAATETGHAWGVPPSWVSWLSIDASDGIEVLAEDENGRAAAWVKSYGGPPGTGFVSLTIREPRIDDLPAIRAVAEYGIVDGAR
jgi:outer membrane protein assembly factor BamB